MTSAKTLFPYKETFINSRDSALQSLQPTTIIISTKKEEKENKCMKKPLWLFASTHTHKAINKKDIKQKMVSRTFDTAYIRKYKYCTLCLVAQSCLTLCDPVDCSPPGTSAHGDSLGKNTGVGSLSLLQGIFPTQVSDPGLPPFRRILYQLSYQGSPLHYYFLFTNPCSLEAFKVLCILPVQCNA